MFAKDGLIGEIRARFAHVDSCPFQGPRVFFENAGGALALKSAVETSTFYASIPDNQGRDNVAAVKLMRDLGVPDVPGDALVEASRGVAGRADCRPYP